MRTRPKLSKLVATVTLIPGSKQVSQLVTARKGFAWTPEIP